MALGRRHGDREGRGVRIGWKNFTRRHGDREGRGVRKGRKIFTTNRHEPLQKKD